MNRWIWLIPIAVIVFLGLYAFVPPMKAWADNLAWNILGPAVMAGVANISANITSMPIYRLIHPLIWLITGIVLTISVHQLYKRDKIPMVHPKATTTISPNLQTMQREPVVEPERAPATTPQPPVQPEQEQAK